MSSRTSSPEDGVLAKWGGVHIQDGLADAAQADRHQALAWPPLHRALHGDPKRRDERITTNQGGRWRTCARAERVADWIHKLSDLI